MKLLIKQKVFSWTDTYDVYDEAGNARYYVKAEFFSVGHVIHVYEHNTNREVGVIKEKILTWTPKFNIEIHGKCVGMIQKKFTLFRPKYEVDFNGWRVEGDFLAWNYDVLSGCCPIMKIKKEPFHWGDTYVIHYQKPEDELMGLLLVIAIDAANCSSNNGD